MTVREVGARELSLLQDIERAAGQCFRDIGMPEIAEDDPLPVDELARYRSAGPAWVAVDGTDRPVAYLIADPVDDGLHVEQVSVHPDSSRRGLGRLLLDHLAARAAARRETRRDSDHVRPCAVERPLLRAVRLPAAGGERTHPRSSGDPAAGSRPRAEPLAASVHAPSPVTAGGRTPTPADHHVGRATRPRPNRGHRRGGDLRAAHRVNAKTAPSVWRVPLTTNTRRHSNENRDCGA
jgi:GNAT superfamily N-acetyltransferase